MGTRDNNTTFPIFIHVLFLCLCIIGPLSVRSQCTRKPVILMFGDSNSDTGGSSFGTGVSIIQPNGRTFFRQPSGRLCDGRLMIDFLCESLNTSYLTPYLDSLSPNFSNGANFAISGSATLPKLARFNLDDQVRQFIRFRSLSPQLISKSYKDLVSEYEFKNALYMIDIGQNDLASSFINRSYAQVIAKIPSFTAEIKLAIWGIYQHGGRNIWVHNTGPLGCLPEKLAMSTTNSSDYDEHGCIRYLNDAARIFNKQLRTLSEELRSQMKDATIVYVDMFSIKYDLISNAAKYGFENPLSACCGRGGPPYNYDPSMNIIPCGNTGYNVCQEGSRYVSWDGVHYTEAANFIFASKILSTNYSTPRVNFNYFCN